MWDEPFTWVLLVLPVPLTALLPPPGGLRMGKGEKALPLASLCLPCLLCKESPLFVLLMQLASEDPFQINLACQRCQA